MAVVAVAGGTGSLGRTIVEAILESGKHEVKILARKPNPALETELGVPIIVVDYSDVEALIEILEDNVIHTVVSAIRMYNTDGSTPREVELIRAADASKTTKRMISNNWGKPHTDANINQLPYVIHKLNAQKELENTKDLQSTIFMNGFFMDYWGIPAIKSYLTPITVVLDIPNHAAAIPGSGNVPVVFTHTTDVAKFVAASLDLDEWDPLTFVKGDKLTWNEFLRLAEDAKGTKFDVTYDSVEKLKTKQATELPGQVATYAFFPKEIYQGLASTLGLWFEEGAYDLKPDRFLNDRLPEIETLKVKDILESSWKKSCQTLSVTGLSAAY